jgi:hypothetical protein
MEAGKTRIITHPILRLRGATDAIFLFDMRFSNDVSWHFRLENLN